MRIDAYNKVSQMYSAGKVSKTSKPSKSSFSDKLEISQVGKDYRLAQQTVAQAPDVRENRISDIMKLMEAGNYNVDMNMVADKLVDRYFDEQI